MSTTQSLHAPLNSAPVSGDIFARLQQELDAQRAYLPDYKKNLDEKWARQTANEPKRLIGPDGKIRKEGFERFRQHQVFVPDTPVTNYESFNLRNIFDGVKRGEKKMLIDCYDRLVKNGNLEYLKKYPSPNIGNPYLFNWKGTTYTYRWHKHIHFIGLVNRFLRNRLSPDYIGLDLGTSYGIFPNLMKKEFPNSHQILVDFPEQLLMAYYFIANYAPGARIAGVKEMASLPVITKEFIQQYDFVLVPVTMYSKIAPHAVNLYSNFASLGEMRREWFKGYIDSPVFQTANYFFCANRYESAPTYDTDVTVLDYPIWDPSKKVHFTTSQAFSHIYTRKRLFFFEKYMYPQYFEYIGAI